MFLKIRPRQSYGALGVMPEHLCYCKDYLVILILVSRENVRLRYTFILYIFSWLYVISLCLCKNFRVQLESHEVYLFCE
jgi:hypothetical protein